MPTSPIISSSSRGIGLELTKQLLRSAANVVIATCRDPENMPKLEGPGTLHVVQLDVSEEGSIRASIPVVSSILGDRGLDYLYNNAAVTEGNDSAFDHSSPGFMRTLIANVVGPALIAQLYLPFIEKSRRKVIVNVTSSLASIGLDIGPKSATYSISKTALNMLVRRRLFIVQAELTFVQTYKQARARPDIIAFVLDPGWVKTKMGGPGALLEPYESVSGIIKTVTSATSASSGKFYRYNGQEVVW
ncbi:C-factor [Sparassis crispa]|uniref:C-factor n=1 Tax=Sparassis crispa TaxID=139825 RepID=A0A401GDM3_9APHY|nr:C-factor [Sparassis crispa]GBE80279.1 C-factor [Sparassis crispa]